MSNIYRILEYWFGGYTLDDYSERWEASGLQPALYFPPYYNINQGGVYPLQDLCVLNPSRYMNHWQYKGTGFNWHHQIIPHVYSLKDINNP